MGTTNEIAPVLISVYDRYLHFKNCIESLKKNKYADRTHLFVAIDAPYEEQHIPNNNNVIEYAKSITGFEEITLIVRDQNIGAENNILSAMDEIFKKYGKLIFSEDDNEFSVDFLSFMNKAMNVFEKREDIFSVSGYNYPIQIPSTYCNDIFIWKGYSAWGVGLWKNKWERVDWSISDLELFLEDRTNVKSLNEIAEHYLPGLRHIIKSREFHGDTMLSYFHVKNNMYTVFPIISRVRNIGHDRSGIHCKYNSIYSNQKICQDGTEIELPLDIRPDHEINRILWKHFKRHSLPHYKRYLNAMYYDVKMKYGLM